MKAYWASKERNKVFLAQDLDTSDIKYLKNQEAMLVLKWFRKDSFYMSYNQEEQIVYNPLYDCSVEIIIYTQEHVVNIASNLEQDWMDYIRSDWDESWHTFDKAYATLPLNQMYAREILNTMAKDKLEWFFQERIVGFVQIPVVVNVEVFCKLKSKNNDKDCYKIFGNIIDMKQLGKALEFEKNASKDIFENKFYFLSRKHQKEANVFLLQLSQLYHRDFFDNQFYAREAKELWYSLLSQTYFEKQQGYDLKDLRPDYVKEGGIWMCTRAFFQFHSYSPEDEDEIIEDEQERYILKYGKKYIYNAFLDQFVIFVCDVNINNVANETISKMLIALPFYRDIEKFGHFTDGDINCEAWFNWLSIREDFMQKNPNTLNPNEYVIFVTNILENNNAKIKICQFNPLNPKEPNLNNLKQIVLDDCYIDSSQIIPLPNFTRDEGGIMYPSSQYANCMLNSEKQNNIFFKGNL